MLRSLAWAGLALITGACFASFEKVEGTSGQGGAASSTSSVGGAGTAGSGATGGQGGAGGAGGGGPACDPVPLNIPADCDAALLSLDDPENCCVAGRRCGPNSTCSDGLCSPVSLATTMGDEALDVVVLDGHVYWTRGYGGDLAGVPVNGGLLSVYATNSPFLTNITADDQYLYFSEYAGQPEMDMVFNEVQRVDPAVGPSSQAVLGQTSGHEARFGEMAVRNGVLYWITQYFNPGPGGAQPVPDSVVWFMATSGGTPQVIFQGGDAQQIAVDDTHAYWTDNTEGIRRVPVASPTQAPETFVPVEGTGDYRGIQTRNGRVYWLQADRAQSIATTGGGITVHDETFTFDPYGFLVDDQHLYLVDGNAGFIHRRPLDGSGPLIPFAAVQEPRTLDDDCDAIYVLRNTEMGMSNGVTRIAK